MKKVFVLFCMLFSLNVLSEEVQYEPLPNYVEAQVTPVTQELSYAKSEAEFKENASPNITGPDLSSSFADTVGEIAVVVTTWFIYGYLLFGTYYGWKLMYPPMITWYHKQFVFIKSKGMFDLLVKQISMKVSYYFSILGISLIVGCLGGAFYVLYKQRRGEPLPMIDPKLVKGGSRVG